MFVSYKSNKPRRELDQVSVKHSVRYKSNTPRRELGQAPVKHPSIRYNSYAILEYIDLLDRVHLLTQKLLKQSYVDHKLKVILYFKLIWIDEMQIIPELGIVQWQTIIDIVEAGIRIMG
jgi:hypothetical protein